MKTLSFIVILFFMFNLFVCSDEIDDLYFKAKRERDPKKAIEMLTKVVRQKPEKTKAYYYLAKAYKNLGEYVKALEKISLYIENNPDDFLGYYLKGRIYVDLKKYDKAINSITEFINNFPESSKGYFERGYIYRYFKKDMKNAVEDFSRVISLNPDDSTAYLERGLSYLNMGDYKKAIKDLSKVIEMDPKNPVAYRERGRCYKELKKYDKAINDFKKSLKYDSTHMWTYYSIASTYYIMDKLEKALEYSKKALKYEKNEVIYELRANILRDMGLLKKALKEINQAIKLGGENYFTRASIYFLMKKEDFARRDLMKAYKKDVNIDKTTSSTMIFSKIKGFKKFAVDVKKDYEKFKEKYGDVE